MGLTIHYTLRTPLRSPARVRQLAARLQSRAMDLPFAEVDEVFEATGPECDFNLRGRDDPHRWLLIQATESVESLLGVQHTVIPTHVIAFRTWPGQGCEPANFGFCRYPPTIEVDDRHYRGKRRMGTRLGGWRWSSFCKTQYASEPDCGGVKNFLRCHLLVVAMLDFAKTLNILGDVYDEGGFWVQRDLEALAREVGTCNADAAALLGSLKDVVGAGLKGPILDFPNFEHLEAKGREKGAPLTELLAALAQEGTGARQRCA